MLRYYLRNWYNISAAVAGVALMVLAVCWNQFDVIQRLVLINFAVMNLHFFEEFGHPGGFPAVANCVMYHSHKPTHCPLNQLTAIIGNKWFAYVVFLLPIFVPHLIWLSLASILFGFVEVVVYGVALNAMLRRWYNPGLWTSLFGFLPVGVIYLIYVHSHGLIQGWDYLPAFVYPMATYLILFRYILVNKMASENIRFPFTEAELARLQPPPPVRASA